MTGSRLVPASEHAVVEQAPGTLSGPEVEDAVERLLDALDAVHEDGWYPAVDVLRPWSRHNPRISGEFARPRAVRGYLHRELSSLVRSGATVTVRASRPAVAFDDPDFFAALDEDRFDLRVKKLFLFGPERMALSLDRLSHYCGTPAESFERHVLFTNYAMHVESFRERFPDSEGPDRDGVQMPAWHHRRPGGDGVSLVNIGVGPANAKTVTDHLAVLRPDTMIMIGHCGGLRNRQELGDFVLATAYQRADHVLDEVLPADVPVIPNHRLNTYLLDALDTAGSTYRLGVVHTTDNRNWELNQSSTLARMRASRSVAVDMESATIAANGFRYRIPNATLLCVSDKPLHAAPKLAGGARDFYETSKRRHLGIALAALDRVRREHPGGLPGHDLRSPDEPLLGATPDEH
ncbi:AMP nucleosidase [Pseudonocardia sp. KRD291]|uniref:phosphorylase family protein n=1 Tax=Pseudonocardia sp. KRD291 TaxID=2792007 RepID=UPI001C4A0131|nr:AMP nucleosidase [Pseudonocardia sp. KRD291]MBW0106137.1 AMP nucleosidase [Pseudonocardia sp. KRD291]